MPKIPIDTVYDGDILGGDLYIDDVFLFGKGTILNSKRIEVLKSFDIVNVEIEPRFKKFNSIKDNLVNLDQRFSYVKDNPFMRELKEWLKEIIINSREYDEEKFD